MKYKYENLDEYGNWVKGEFIGEFTTFDQSEVLEDVFGDGFEYGTSQYRCELWRRKIVQTCDKCGYKI